MDINNSMEKERVKIGNRTGGFGAMPVALPSAIANGLIIFAPFAGSIGKVIPYIVSLV